MAIPFLKKLELSALFCTTLHLQISTTTKIYEPFDHFLQELENGRGEPELVSTEADWTSDDGPDQDEHDDNVELRGDEAGQHRRAIAGQNGKVLPWSIVEKHCKAVTCVA